MSAPVTERVRSGGRTAPIPAQRAGAAERTARRAAERAEPSRRSAQQKAYARREERLRRAGAASSARATAPAGRPQFVLLVMTLLAVALVATLWLSTAAAADSYRLEDATAEARKLSQQVERLHQEVAVLQSAPELARRAAELGMTPVQDPARLVIAPDGTVSVVGEPRVAAPPPPPAPAEGQPGPATDPNAAGRSAGGDAEGDEADGGIADGAPADPEGSGIGDGARDDGSRDDGADAAQLAAPREQPGQERAATTGAPDRSAAGSAGQTPDGAGMGAG